MGVTEGPTCSTGKVLELTMKKYMYFVREPNSWDYDTMIEQPYQLAFLSLIAHIKRLFRRDLISSVSSEDERMEESNIESGRITFWTFLLFLGLAEGADVDFGWITPSNTVENSACFNASQRYIAAFGDANEPSKNPTWGPLMMDADGRLPMEGFLSDTLPIPISLCDTLNGTAQASCNKLPSSLTNLLIHVPFGFHHNPGSMDLCLEGGHTDFGVRTKYCTVNMVPPDMGIGGMQPSPWRKDQSYVKMLANIAEWMDQMKRVTSTAISSKNNATEIFGFDQFQNHMKELAKEDTSVSTDQVGIRTYPILSHTSKTTFFSRFLQCSLAYGRCYR